jgi:GNAT superfamily N-acetyltransferase
LTPDILLEPLVIPASLDAPDAADFLRLAALERLICEEETGIAELAHTAAEMLPRWQQQTDHRLTGYLARIDERIVGAASIQVSLSEGADTVEFDLLVPTAQWGRGVEAALLAEVEHEARRRRMPVLQTWTLHRPMPGARPLSPRTGWGHVPATALSDLLEDAGFLLEQVERTSSFDLRADPALLRARRDEALRIAGADYRVVSWTPPTPPEHRAGYADLRARLDTDMPSGELETLAERWDADRVSRWDQLFLDSGEHLSVVAVQHVPTGELVAFNELVIGVDRTASTHQLGTLVRADHRGHRLGMVVKCEGLLRWQEAMPASPRVLTYNAEENRPMLDVNEAVGFVPVAAAAAWQKRLDG